MEVSMPDAKNYDSWTPFFVGILIGSILVSIVVSSICSDVWRADAVKVGVAEYTADANGYVKWQWKTPKIEKESPTK
jgi:hypothetical protein